MEHSKSPFEQWVGENVPGTRLISGRFEQWERIELLAEDYRNARTDEERAEIERQGQAWVKSLCAAVLSRIESEQG